MPVDSNLIWIEALPTYVEIAFASTPRGERIRIVTTPIRGTAGEHEPSAPKHVHFSRQFGLTNLVLSN